MSHSPQCFRHYRRVHSQRMTCLELSELQVRGSTELRGSSGRVSNLMSPGHFVDKTTNTPSPLYLRAYTWLILKHRIALDIYLFFFSSFNFRFSFGLRCAFFCFSLLPLSLLPLSPMSVSPCLKLTYAGHGGTLFVLISDQNHTPMIEYNSGVCEGQEKTPAINTGINLWRELRDDFINWVIKNPAA